VGAGNGALAWAYLGRNPAYREAWAAHAAPPTFEDAHILVRIQQEADLSAEAFGLLAWTDPAGNATPFWSVSAPLAGEFVVPGQAPLAALLCNAGTRLEGLRTLDGALLLKAERGDVTVQVRIPAPCEFTPDAGLVVRIEVGLGLPMAIERMRDLWEVAGVPGPRGGRERGASTRSF